MSEPFIAEVKIFAGNFAPRGFAFCDGQLLPIAQNTALFSLIGTTYGGDGRTTTGLPNMQNRLPMHPGNGPGLTQRRLGERAGVNSVTLTAAQSASHDHSVTGSEGAPNTDSPAGAYPAMASIYNEGGSVVAMGTTASIGGGQAHNNDQPYQVLNFIIALVGVFPSRS